MKAIALHKEGITNAEILRRVGVSKSTLGLWLRDVPLDLEEAKRLLHGRELSRFAAAQWHRDGREKRVNEGLARGKREFPSLVKNPLFISGLCLYWAEGDKHRQERVKFTNSDPHTVTLMMRWFREICAVPEKKFRIALHVHTLHIAPDIQSYWSKITGVPQEQFQKIYIKPTSLRQRRNVLYNGTCAIVVNDKALFRKMQGWKIGLLKYFALPVVQWIERGTSNP